MMYKWLSFVTITDLQSEPSYYSETHLRLLLIFPLFCNPNLLSFLLFSPLYYKDYLN